MEQCENAASLLASVREQEMQFERLTRALEEERRSVGPSGTLPRPLPTLQVTPSQPITQQQGSLRHHPCRITLHQCVLVGTSRSMAINPSFTDVFNVTRTHFLHSFLLSSFNTHPPFVILMRIRLHHSADYGVWHHRILACFLMSPICLSPHNHCECPTNACLYMSLTCLFDLAVWLFFNEGRFSPFYLLSSWWMSRLSLKLSQHQNPLLLMSVSREITNRFSKMSLPCV